VIKIRTGYRKIVVGNHTYQFSISLRAGKVIVYDQQDCRFELPLDSQIPTRVDRPSTWRGKHREGGFGKYEVSQIIKQHIAKAPL
jgi:hypothetical protein